MPRRFSSRRGLLLLLTGVAGCSRCEELVVPHSGEIVPGPYVYAAAGSTFELALRLEDTLTSAIDVDQWGILKLRWSVSGGGALSVTDAEPTSLTVTNFGRPDTLVVTAEVGWWPWPWSLRRKWLDPIQATVYVAPAAASGATVSSSLVTPVGDLLELPLGEADGPPSSVYLRTCGSNTVTPESRALAVAGSAFLDGVDLRPCTTNPSPAPELAAFGSSHGMIYRNSTDLNKSLRSGKDNVDNTEFAPPLRNIPVALIVSDSVANTDWSGILAELEYYLGLNGAGFEIDAAPDAFRPITENQLGDLSDWCDPAAISPNLAEAFTQGEGNQLPTASNEEDLESLSPLDLDVVFIILVSRYLPSADGSDIRGQACDGDAWNSLAARVIWLEAPSIQPTTLTHEFGHVMALEHLDHWQRTDYWNLMIGPRDQGLAAIRRFLTLGQVYHMNRHESSWAQVFDPVVDQCDTQTCLPDDTKAGRSGAAP